MHLSKSQALKLFLVAFLFLLVAFSEPAHAMHIMEGYLPLKWVIIWFAIFIPFFCYGVYQIKESVKKDSKNKVLLALSGAFIFILSSLKIPSVTGSTSHPTGVSVGTYLFGPGVISVLGTICLLFQALFLAHGGLTTLGANAFSMAVVGPFVGYAVYRLGEKINLPSSVNIFLCAALADLATYMTTSFQLALAHPDPALGIFAAAMKFMGVFMITQIPLAIVEGLLSVVMVNMINDTVLKEVKK
ncbi:energy-coupling factor ABC transporter permease [Aerococcus tenax]|uniref:energy-coupling factor ABC transporter permease n=1 Tax=Aerococcus tenax TaxID=3078812 RepID=UPI0018A770E6|nr:energy-coupling factor ABC transporter permease [Aerococcus tenax]